MGKKVLGKGLDALIPKKTGALLPKEFTYLPLDKIKTSKRQPRQEIGEKELQELASSIKEKGLIQPIVVRRLSDGQCEVVAGERRFQAAKSLGLKELPTIIKDLDEKDSFIIAIIENLQRKDLNPIEEANAFKRLMEEFNFTLEDIGRFVSKDKTTIANTLRLLRLPEDIKKALREGIISRSQARTILSVNTPAAQDRLFHQILKGGLSVRDIEKKARTESKKKRSTDPFVVEVEQRLQKSLGTKVKIFNKRNNCGRIAIEYYNLKDLERIIGKIK